MQARAVAAAVLAGGLLLASLPAGAQPDNGPPQTGFEKRNGGSWTTHKEELKFLAEVDRRSDRVAVDVIGKTLQNRPLQLVEVGHPKPHGRRAALRQPTILFVCTQHGNEPAGREACLKLLRDLGFTDDKALIEFLSEATVLFIPTANPDGREANSRGNSQGVDINRDHLNLNTLEGQAIAAVVRDWRPDVVLDLHEYGPSLPVLYDEEVLYLWPRNLNVDDDVHNLAHKLATKYVATAAEEAGYSSDTYGMYDVGPQDIHQSAGGPDEGIARNAMGLRHSLGILIESAVTADPRNGPQEVLSEAEVRLRRVDSHMAVSDGALGFMQELGATAMKVTAAAFRKAVVEGRDRSEPVYFGGADNDEPSEDEMQNPPPCGYALTREQAKSVRSTLRLLGISAGGAKGGPYVTMAQGAEPLIALLLDERAERHSVAATPDMDC